MSNVIVEGFASYGVGSSSFFVPQAAIAQAMLSGIWAQVADYMSLTTLPWDTANTDIYASAGFIGAPAGDGSRRVLPASLNVSRWSWYFACDKIPQAVEGSIISFRDGSNYPICELFVTSTGALVLITGFPHVQLGITNGPVVVAQTAVHMEAELNVSAGTFKLYVQDKLVLNIAGAAFTGSGPCAQFAILNQVLSGTFDGSQYLANLIVRDTNGSFNNSFPIGDRRVATLFPASDDGAHQGWSGHPIHRFGSGVLDLTAVDVGLNELQATVTTNDNAHTDIGAGDFTIEGQFRFQRLPLTGNKSVLWGKWDETNNLRSYQLYIGGPSLENGLLVFRTSTDGTNGTVVEKLKWAFSFDVRTWYEICLERVSGELVLFINGVQQGLPIADTDTYFSGGTELFALGSQTVANTLVPATNFRGWVDEFRFSKGLGRYTGNYAPHTAAFPRNTGDPNWGSVVWLSSFDLGVVADDGPLALPLVAWNSAKSITPGDGAFFYQLLDKNSYPFDDSFIQAAFIAATNLLTFTGQPSSGDTVTVGTKDGTAAAVYKFVGGTVVNPFDVLIGSNVAGSMSNLVAAIMAAGGAGTTYGTGTTANANVSATLQPSNQVQVTALVAGTVGNAIASTTTATLGSWATATLTGGLNIPPYSQYGLSRLPSNTSLVDSVTIGSRQWKTDAGVASSQISLVGGGGGVLAGATNPLSTTPSVTFDTFETDPDAPTGPTNPTAILLAKVRINRIA